MKMRPHHFLLLMLLVTIPVSASMRWRPWGRGKFSAQGSNMADAHWLPHTYWQPWPKQGASAGYAVAQRARHVTSLDVGMGPSGARSLDVLDGETESEGSEINFQDGEGGARWAFNCDYPGNDIRTEMVPGERCGGLCLEDPKCTHFSWKRTGEGEFCTLKGNGVHLTEQDAVRKDTDNAVCGRVRTNIKGTLGDRAPYSTPCDIPKADYAITDYVYLGEQTQLGSLKWKSNLCGHVLDIDCGHGVIKAVVKAQCMLRRGGACGIGFFEDSWSKATNGLGVSETTTCAASLSTTNPLRGDSPVCYHSQFGSDENTFKFLELKVYNTEGRIAISATVDGFSGRPSTDGFSFTLKKPGSLWETIPFSRNSKVRFEFDSGPAAKFRLSDCKKIRG